MNGINKRKLARLLGSSALLLDLTYAGVANAATGPEPSASAPQTTVAPVKPASDSGGATKADGDEAQVDDIVVTAQRRSERLQNVPITITALTSATLESSRVVDTSGIQTLTPGIQLTRSGSGGTTFIRGIGNPSGAAGDEGANAYYVDGVYIPNLLSNLFSFNNIERIEVLKGPQGTLFGRNASGGVIQIITKDPTREPSMNVTMGYGNYKTMRAAAFLSGPITDTLRISVAGIINRQDKGWGRNAFDGQETFFDNNEGLQGKIVWEPSSTTKLTLSADYSHSFGDIGPRVRILPGAVPAARPTALYTGFYDVNSNIRAIGDRTVSGGSATLVQDLGFAELTAIGARRFTRNRLANDLDTTTVDLVNTDAITRDRTWTGEVRLASKGQTGFTWLAGVYYLNDVVSQGYPAKSAGLAFAPLAYINQMAVQRTDSYAGFAQVTVPVFEGTRLTGGLRYSSDLRNFSGEVLGVFPNGTTQVNTAFLTRRVRYNSWTWRAAAEHDFSKDVMLYASYARGFKSGLFALNVPSDPPVAPQYVDAVEIGLKAELFDRKLQINTSLFYNWFTDIQLRSAATAPLSRLLNAARAESRGIDVSFSARPTSRISINGGFEVLDAKYKSFATLFPFTYPRPAVCPASQQGTSNPGQTTGAPTGGNLTCFGRPNGFDMIQSPPFSGNIGLNYSVPTRAGNIVFGTNYSYNGGFYWEADNRLKQKPYGVWDATIGFELPKQQLTVTFWMKNITDAHYYYQEAGTSVADVGVPAAPRTFGVDLKFKFGS